MTQPWRDTDAVTGKKIDPAAPHGTYGYRPRTSNGFLYSVRPARPRWWHFRARRRFDRIGPPCWPTALGAQITDGSETNP